MLKEKNVLLGITGGIAAYKAIDLASKLKKAGANIKTVMTENSLNFVNELSFRAITANPVSTDLFNSEDPIEHISLAEWADIIVIAPATANIIAKVSNGIADDLLSTIICASRTPILIVPAMNVHMYENQATQENIKKLSSRGFNIMIPETGRLACGYEGRGRFPSTGEIVSFIKTYLHYQKDYAGKKVLVTAGACREHLDPMRFLSNVSSGKTGLSLAKALYIRGAEVRLIHAHLDQKPPYYIDSQKAVSAEEMYKSCVNNLNNFDIIIMNAAVTDFTFSAPSKQKLKKTSSTKIDFHKTKDILQELGKQKETGQILVGFAAETNNLIENAKKKLKQKQLDMVIANNIQVATKDSSKIFVVSKDKNKKYEGSKFELAHKILNEIKDI